MKNGEQVNDPGSIFHMQQTEKFRKKHHYLLNASPISKTYKGTEVFLLERFEKKVLAYAPGSYFAFLVILMEFLALFTLTFILTPT